MILGDHICNMYIHVEFIQLHTHTHESFQLRCLELLQFLLFTFRVGLQLIFEFILSWGFWSCDFLDICK